MKYNIFVNQLVLSKTKLDLKDCAILDYLRAFCQTDDKNIKQLEIKEAGISYNYTWINFNYLIKEMPLLRLKQKASISERIGKIEKAGFIKTFRAPDRSIYVRLTEKIKELEFQVEEVLAKTNRGVSQNKQEVLAKTNSTIILSINHNINNNNKINGDSQESPSIKPLKAREIKPEPLETTPVVSPGSGFQDTNALSVSNRNALSVNNNKINGEFKNSPPIQSLKRKEFKVKPEEYKEITDAYQRYKGIELSGAEFGEVKRAIKTMLYSGRTKENIIAFMRFCADVCQAIKEGDKDIEKRLGWLQDWTMLTIKRKMPEFLAGKFKKVDDDETLEHIPEIARSWLK